MNGLNQSDEEGKRGGGSHNERGLGQKKGLIQCKGIKSKGIKPTNE